MAANDVPDGSRLFLGQNVEGLPSVGRDVLQYAGLHQVVKAVDGRVAGEVSQCLQGAAVEEGVLGQVVPDEDDEVVERGLLAGVYLPARAHELGLIGYGFHQFLLGTQVYALHFYALGPCVRRLARLGTTEGNLEGAQLGNLHGAPFRQVVDECGTQPGEHGDDSAFGEAGLATDVAHETFLGDFAVVYGTGMVAFAECAHRVGGLVEIVSDSHFS